MERKTAFNSFFITLILSITNCFALVDYTEPEYKPKNSGASRVSAPRESAPAATSTRKVSRRGSARSGERVLSMSTWYKTVEAKFSEGSGKAHFLGLKGKFHTPYNLYLDASYWQADSSSELLTEGGSSQKGNPELILGLNWLRFGPPSEVALVDFYGGVSLGQESEFAHSRTDQIVGVTTAKRFNQLALGLGYELRLTGDADSEEELEIGNISRLSASLGWMTSNEIRFSVDGHMYSISSSSSDKPNKLEEKVKFATVIPKLGLNLSPIVLLELGASFRTRRINDAELLGARLWSLHGAYGNSVFANFGVSL